VTVRVTAISCSVAGLIKLSRLRAYIGDFGVGGLVLSLGRRGSRHARYAGRRLTEAPETFDYRGERYTAIHHRRGRTWLTERAIELPVAMRFVDGSGPSGFGLEVGNVLSRYRAVHHRVVDRYERAPGVENLDVLNITTERPFDFVVSISTIEHVGWDEPERDLDKPVRAIEHLRSLLRPDGGRMLVTLPLGYNPTVDLMALGGSSGAEYGEIFVRDRHLRWTPTPRPEPHQLRYEFELRSASAVWIAEFGRRSA
jgi:SAM-dependent methyltransferase